VSGRRLLPERLTAAGITKADTLFVFTVDEGDHLVGVEKSGRDGLDQARALLQKVRSCAADIVGCAP
jgi:hypothetical protein